MTIDFYKEFGELGYLANYSNHSFIKNGILYKTVEHYYQSEKFPDGEIKNRIINALTPKEASNIGRDRSNIRVDNFTDIKLDVMYEGVLEKFRQNRNILYKLIETRNSLIREATIDEYYWGIGKTKTGLNHMGLILCKVRRELKKELLNTILDNARKEEIVYVIGHNVPDCDSIFSSLLLSKVLRGLGINAQFAVLSTYGNYSISDVKLINEFLKEEPVVIDINDTLDKKFILVDHNNLEGLNANSVIGAIDHHIITNEVYDTLEIEYASTGLLIYDLFKDMYEFNEQEKLLIGLTVLADTEYLCSKRYTADDKLLYESLNLDIDVKEYQSKYFVINDFSKSINDNLLSNYKEYKRNNKVIKRSLIYSYNNEYLTYFDEYVKYINELSDNRLLIWCNYEDKTTRVVYNDKYLKLDYILTSSNLILNMLNESTM